MAKRTKRNFSKMYFLTALLAAVIVSIPTVGSYLYYQSRRLPDHGEERMVTELPPNIKNVLGTNTLNLNSINENYRVPIFLYHYIEYVKDKGDTIRSSLNIVPTVFEEQIKTLKDAGYMFVTPSYLSMALEGKFKPVEKMVILSFDDGYMDFYTDVFPILKKENVKAVVYIVPNFLDRPNYMYTWQLKEIAKSNLIEIGAHTMDHVWLKGMDPQRAQNEITESRVALQNLLNLPIDSFAYPYGAFDEVTLSLVRNAGFRNAVSTVPDVTQTTDNSLYLYRLRPGYRTGEALLKFIHQTKFLAWQ